MAFTLLLAVALGAQAEPPAETRPPAARTVYFAVNAAGLDAPARQVLDGVAQWLHVNPAIQIVIEGHADARGTPAHNLALAARRAEAVRDWLVHRGIRPAGSARPASARTAPLSTMRASRCG